MSLAISFLCYRGSGQRDVYSEQRATASGG